ncbi:MauE/DoxX family redox-associated membrane protein [Pseudonocardia sp. RS010]|uniref:MauE/DoxX family redox-associated membrane protein n=1 Tax=Pseudonocardia sp. RS010 TaxID=3385979 RepID=UPI0039A2DCB8
MSTDAPAPRHAATRSPEPSRLPWVALLARLVLGGVWIAAGAAKVTALDESVRAVRAYRLLPDLAAQIVGAGLPLVEIVLGLLLVVGLGVRASAVVSALLMAAFVVGIASAWARGLRIDCGCFGSGGELAAGEDPAYGWELARDGALLLLALFLAARPPGRLALDGFLATRKETI